VETVCDVLGELDQVVGHVAGDPHIEVGGDNGPGGPVTTNWNPFLVDEGQETIPADTSGGPNTQLTEAQQVFVGNTVADDVEGVGPSTVVRVSQLSDSSSDSTRVVGTLPKKRTHKKGPQQQARATTSMLGVPKFCQLAMAVSTAGRRRKENGKENQNASEFNQAILTPQEEDHDQHPAIDLHVQLPLPASGINYVLDSDVDSVSDSIQEGGGEEVAKEEEAKRLIGIQKEVEFSFEVGDEEIQSKLVELDEVDRKNNVEREQQRGYQ
jgi:hypothetical protein